MGYKQGGEPNAVRVWRGYRAKHMLDDPAAFYQALSEIFIPVTVQIMEPLGLIAYFPTILTPNNEDLPDELALVFYEDQSTYTHASRETAAGRAYGLLHRNVFSHKSRSHFPNYFTNMIDINTPYYLFDNKTQWRTGSTRVYVGKLHSNENATAFLGNLAAAICYFRDKTQTTVDGAILLIENNHIFYWEHQINATNTDSLIPSLSRISTKKYLGEARPVIVPTIDSGKDSVVSFTVDETLNVSLS